MGLGHWLVSKPSLLLLLNGTCWHSASCRMLLWNGIASWLISRPVSAMPCVSADCLMALSKTTGALSLCLTFSFLGVWMSCGFHNGVPQTAWLKTNRNVLSHSSGARSPKSRSQSCYALSKGSRGEFLLAYSTSWWPQAFQAWDNNAPTSASLSTWQHPLCLSSLGPNLPLIRYQSYWIRLHPDNLI